MAGAWLRRLVILITVLLPATADPAQKPHPFQNTSRIRQIQDPAPWPPNVPEASPPAVLDLQAALETTLVRNPDLVSLRQDLPVSAEAVEVARRFPTSLNPSVSVEVNPWVFERIPADGIERLHTRVTVAWNQPIELGHRGQYRWTIAQASFEQTRWSVLQAELLALVRTYRAYQKAVYAQQKVRVAERLVAFQDRLIQVLRRRVEANQAAAADALLAEVESQTSAQTAEVARQEYAAALAELSQQIGVAAYAEIGQPSGELQRPEFPLPEAEETLVQNAIECRPEVREARAKLTAARAAVCLARADRIPIPSVGPAYERDESGVTFYGFAVSSPVPVLNSGSAEVRQREAECRRAQVALQQTQQKIAGEVSASAAKWRQAQQLVDRTQALAAPLSAQAERMDRLFTAGQADVLKLLQVQQRAIESSNAQLDATWQAIQAYADLLSALGATPLLSATAPAQAGDRRDSPSLRSTPQRSGSLARR